MHVSVHSSFPLGRLVATRTALAVLKPWDIHSALKRHARGDWGNVCPEDRKANDESVALGGRILSVYQSNDGQSFWIITEGDRSATTILLPDDY